MREKTGNVVESIHTSTLKTVLADVVKDSKSSKPDEIANFIVDKFFSGLGRKGKVRSRNGHLEFYSEFACLDSPYNIGRQLFILEE